jgi:uncharacterized protein YdaL
MNSWLQRGWLWIAVAMLAACGGGGSDPFYKPPTVDPSPPPPFGTTTPVVRAPISALPAPVRLPPTGPKVLVLYDQPEDSPFAKMGLSYGIALQNLLGHFDAAIDMQPLERYTAGAIEGYDATFYLGWSVGFDLPPAFLRDVAATTRKFIWLRSNLDQLAALQGTSFESQRGFKAVGQRGFDSPAVPGSPVPGFFSTVYYKNLAFAKSAQWVNGDLFAMPEAFVTEVTDNTKAKVYAAIGNTATKESAPYVLQSGNFWFVADMPFDYVGARDRYLVFADLLHDMLGVDHPENHQAMVRFEDIDAKVNPAGFVRLVDFMASRNVPFSLAVIPHYKDPYGAQSAGVPTDIPMAQATNLRLALDYALARGGDLLQHGTTHQSDTMKNNVSGATGIDYEFWDVVNNQPMPQDSVAWAQDRIQNGLRQMLDLGFQPLAWETPHYVGSPATLRAVSQIYQTAYQRHTYFTSDQPNLTAAMGQDFVVEQYFPFIIERERYGLRVLPESLGNLQYKEFGADQDITSVDILENARYQRVVRDSFASFFFHPFLVVAGGTYDGRGYQHLTEIVDGLSAAGYTWTSPSRLKQR